MNVYFFFAALDRPKKMISISRGNWGLGETRFNSFFMREGRGELVFSVAAFFHSRGRMHPPTLWEMEGGGKGNKYSSYFFSLIFFPLKKTEEYAQFLLTRVFGGPSFCADIFKGFFEGKRGRNNNRF